MTKFHLRRARNDKITAVVGQKGHNFGCGGARNYKMSPVAGQKLQNCTCGGPETKKIRLWWARNDIILAAAARNYKMSPVAGQKLQNFIYLFFRSFIVVLKPVVRLWSLDYLQKTFKYSNRIRCATLNLDMTLRPRKLSLLVLRVQVHQIK